MMRPYSLLHALYHRFGQEHRTLDEKLQLIETGAPGDLFEGQHGLRSGGVDHENVDRPERPRDVAHQAIDLRLIADIGAERLRDAGGGADALGDSVGPVGVGEIIHRHACATVGQRRAIAAPKPRDAPVTSATRFFRSIGNSPSG